MTEGETIVFEAERPFQLWFYTVGHSCLLLRSVPRREGDTRIDVLFTSVSYVELPQRLPALTVLETSRDAWPEDHPVNRDDVIDRNSRVYRLSWPNGSGCIVAAACASHEDNLSYGDPSYFEGRAFLPSRFSDAGAETQD